MSVTISGILPASTHLSGNIIELKATTSGIPAGASEYKILLKIVSADNILFGTPFMDAIAPDSAGVARFDISGIVDQNVNKDFHWPIPTQYEGRWHGYVNLVYDIFLIPGEMYVNQSNVLVENWQAAFGTIFIVKGKLNDLVLSQLNQSNNSWFDYFCAGGRWFTYQPLTQYITPYQPIKLWWKPPTTGLNFTLNAKGYYSDGSVKNYADFPTMWYDVMFEFELQPSGLGFPPIDGDAKLLKFEVWMTGTPSVEKRTFIIDWAYHEEVWFLLADNQIGGIDCISLTGAIAYNPSGERKITGKPFEKGMAIKQRTQIVSGNKRTRRWQINSGYKSKAEMTALDVLLDTPNAWLLMPPIGGSDFINQYSIVPVIITSTEMQLTDSMQDQQSIDIEITEAY
jgi:hypothetical protein